ncbi:MAG: hypothetical protein AAF404_04645 [Pseudomonadota bacterium]
MSSKRVAVLLPLVAGSLGLAACQMGGIKTSPVSKELVSHPAAVQVVGYQRTTKFLKGEVRTAEAVSIEGDVVFFKTDDGHEWKNLINPMLPSPYYSGPDWGTGSQEISDIEGGMFPPTVGNTTSFTASGKSDRTPEGWSEKRDCEVESQERVSIEAGELDTFKVVCKSEWREREYYFSPSLNDIVLFRSAHKTDPKKSRGWELAKLPAV